MMTVCMDKPVKARIERKWNMGTEYHVMVGDHTLCASCYYGAADEVMQEYNSLLKEDG